MLYSNFQSSWEDCGLDPDTDMLWYLHHGQRQSVDQLIQSDVWHNRKNIFLVDCEIIHLFENDISWQQDPRVHVFTPSAIDNDKSHTFHFWFNWMQEAEQSLNWASRLTDSINKEYMFDALLGSERPHKTIVSDFIQQSSNSEKFLYSYSGNPHLNPDMIWIPSYDNEISGNHVNYRGQQYINPASVIPYLIYNKTWYTLVAETDSDFRFYTEKTGKPLMSKRIFVMFAAQHHLKYLRDSGFKTFDGIIDESYDNIADTETRFQEAWKQVEFLLAQDPILIYNKSKEILEHNQKHFMQTNWQEKMFKKIQNILHSSK